MSDPASRYRILHPFTGPPWKNCPGVITPSCLNTITSFITNCTSRNASMSSSGFRGTAMRSAIMPTAIGPRSFSVSLTRYPLMVSNREEALRDFNYVAAIWETADDALQPLVKEA